MKRTFFTFLYVFFFVCAYAQTEKYIELDNIRYRVLSEADGSSTFGTVSVARPEIGNYKGDVIIPNAIKESKDAYADTYKVIGIDEEAFCGADELLTVKLPPSIESMGEGAFQNSSIESISIPVGNLLEIGKLAFCECEYLKEISIPSTVKIIGEQAFSDCGVSKVIFNEGLEKLSQEAFSGCSDLSCIKIPNSVHIIDNGVFDHCLRLYSVSIGAGVKRIGDNCFSWCLRLRSLVLPDGLKEIGKEAFAKSGITEIVIPIVLPFFRQGLILFCQPREHADYPERTLVLANSRGARCPFGVLDKRAA